MTVDISKYQDTFQRLAHGAVACVPEAWDEGRLTIALHGDSLRYQLESDSNETSALVTEQLGELCAELYLSMEMDGQPWSQCVISFTRTPDDSWNFEVKFTYPES
jgi:hypothetical protein